jgi:hypothetical protein
MTRRWTELLGYTSLVWTTLSLTALLPVKVSAQESSETLRCLVGWGSDVVRVIPPHWINDGYCDCPLDGADETNTDACSGIDAWPGSNIAVVAAAADGDDIPDPQVTYVTFIWMDIYVCCCCFMFFGGDAMHLYSIAPVNILHPLTNSLFCTISIINFTVLPPFSARNNPI